MFIFSRSHLYYVYRKYSDRENIIHDEFLAEISVFEVFRTRLGFKKWRSVSYWGHNNLKSKVRDAHYHTTMSIFTY